MSDALHLGWSQGVAQARAGQYRAALGIYLALYGVAGLGLVLVPSVVAHALALPPHHGGLRAVGGLVLLVALLQLPAWQDAVRSRVTALVAMLGRFGIALLWVAAGGRFVGVGLVEAAFAVLLAALLFRFFSAELMSRP